MYVFFINCFKLRGMKMVKKSCMVNLMIGLLNRCHSLFFVGLFFPSSVFQRQTLVVLEQIFFRDFWGGFLSSTIHLGHFNVLCFSCIFLVITKNSLKKSNSKDKIRISGKTPRKRGCVLTNRQEDLVSRGNMFKGNGK